MRKILAWLEAGLFSAATLGLVVMMLSISFDALGRYFFNSPFRGNFELTSLYLMVILVFSTLSANHAEGVHVRLDVLSKPLERRFGRMYTRMIALICLPVFGYFAWHASVEAVTKFAHLETRMGSIPFPIYLSYVWVALGSITLCARFLLDVVAPEPVEGHDTPGEIIR